MFSILILHLCLHGSACFDKKIDIYQNIVYCEKQGIMEAAKIASSFPTGYEIVKWNCTNGR